MPRNVKIAFGLAVAVLLSAGAISYRAFLLTMQSEAWVLHTHEVLENLLVVGREVESIESFSRGYVFDPNSSHMSEFNADILNVNRHILEVERLTADNPVQQQRIQALKDLSGQKIKFAQMLIDLRQKEGEVKAGEAIKTGEGRRLMGQLKALTADFNHEEELLMQIRLTESSRRVNQSKIIAVAGILLALLITSGAAWMLKEESWRRTLAEHALVESETRLRELLESAPDATLVISPTGEIIQLNVQTEVQFGYGRAELVGATATRILPEGFLRRVAHDTQPETYGQPAAAAPTVSSKSVAESSQEIFELIGLRKDGTRFPAEIRVSPLGTSSGVLIIAAIRDITEHRRQEELLARTVMELKRSNVDLQQYAYVVSHDLQEPLRMVTSYTQLLADRYGSRLDGDALEFIGFAVDGCKRMRRLMSDLLVYSRVGNQEKVLTTIGDVALKQALENLRDSIEQSDAVITHGPLPATPVNGSELVQVLQNLIQNAIKYRGTEAPRVHISADKNGCSEWIFAVQDNGIGIDSRYFEKIFILFKRLHNRSEIDGTGIGLTICKKILEQAGGRIWVESRLGHGSTFFFALPQTDAD